MNVRAYRAFLVGLTLCVAAGDALPASDNPVINAAVEKRNAAVSEARDDYVTKVTALDTQLIADLNKPMQTALHAQKLEAANEIGALKKQAEERLKSETAPVRPTPIGDWFIRFKDGNGTWFIKETTVTLRHSDGRLDHATATLEGISIIARYDNGYIERLTPSGPRICLESWNPSAAAKFPHSDPTAFGVGDRILEK